MTGSRTIVFGFAIVLLALVTADQAISQTAWQLILLWQDPQQRDSADVARIMGPI